MEGLDRAARLLERLARLLALGGGVVLVLVASVAALSIAGRNLPLGWRIPGDVEIAQLGTAFAVLAFLPYAHLSRANVIVDVVTQRLPGSWRARLDRAADLLYLAIALLLLLELGLGVAEKLANGAESMVLRIPEWASLAVATLSLGVLVLAIARTVVSGRTGPAS